MDESILTTIKKLLGIDSSYNAFDQDIIVHINTTISILYQLGIDSCRAFTVHDDSETWGDLLDNDELLNPVQTYMYLRVKSMFDPVNGSVNESLNRIQQELEWRINVTVDPKDFW